MRPEIKSDFRCCNTVKAQQLHVLNCPLKEKGAKIVLEGQIQ